MEVASAERVSAALRDPASALAHLDSRGFGVFRRPQRDPAVQAARHRRREDAGLCPSCGSASNDGTVACATCLATVAAARRRLKAAGRARGLCPVPLFSLPTAGREPRVGQMHMRRARHPRLPDLRPLQSPCGRAPGGPYGGGRLSPVSRCRARGPPLLRPLRRGGRDAVLCPPALRKGAAVTARCLLSSRLPRLSRAAGRDCCGGRRTRRESAARR